MKAILYIILFIFGACIFLMFMPLAIGAFFAFYNFENGNYGWALFSIVLGLLFQWGYFAYLYGGSVGGGGDGSCPSCGSGDTDGNHCYSCGDDF